MQIRCIAIDDEPLSLDLTRAFLSRFPSLVLLQTFSDALSGAEYIRNNPVDLLFLDINMPDITGIDLVRSLPKRPMIIFVTAYRKFAVEGFELDAVDYLVKPFTFERFEKAIRKAIHRFETEATKPNDDALFVRSEYQVLRIPLEEIEYIESVEDYVKIHRTGDRPIMSLMTMKSVLSKLPADRFKRIHRSYIIPISKIRSVVNRKVKLDIIELPIGYSYLQEVSTWLK